MRRIAVALTLVLAGTSCGRTIDGPAPLGADPGHEDAWELVSGRGPSGEIPIVAGYPLTLEIDGDEASGRAACNLYTAQVRVEPPSFSARGVGGTEMGCAPRVMRSEQRYYEALPGADRIELDADEMTLTGPRTRLVFRRPTQ